jgi:hypothetical protein
LAVIVLIRALYRLTPTPGNQTRPDLAVAISTFPSEQLPHPVHSRKLKPASIPVPTTMIELPIREAEEIRRGLAAKLRQIDADGQFSVALACFLADEWATPRIEELHLTSSRYLIVRFTGEAEFRKYKGTRADLIREIHAVAKAADLDGDELGHLLGKVAELKGLR